MIVQWFHANDERLDDVDIFMNVAKVYARCVCRIRLLKDVFIMLMQVLM